MLHAHRDIGNQPIQRIPVQRTCHRLVVADGADPAVVSHDRGPQDPGQLGLTGHLGGADPQRILLGCSRVHVKMVIVQAGYHRAECGVEYVFAGLRR